ncbi:MAG: acyltransferase [Chloroflexota bacterium]|nr:acyltransferase [Chloroflexota bacterium]
MRRLPILRGVAILAVVCHHAAGWGFTALIWAGWNQGSNPAYSDLIGTPAYYALVVIQQLALFSVPAFLFIAGFFIAYAARGNPPSLGWKVVRARITNLLWPYIVWSVVIYASYLLQGADYSLLEFLQRLITGNVIGAYFFVPLLCQFYLLSPLIVRLAKHRGSLLLITSALIQLTMIGLWYLHLFGVPLPEPLQAISRAGTWFSGWWAFYFPFGIVCGFHIRRFQMGVARFKRVLLIGVVLLGVLSILEFETLYRFSQSEWLRSPMKFSTWLYAAAFILFFIALDRRSIPFIRTFNQIGTRSYGIYLLHPKAMELLAKTMYHVTPWFLPHQILFQPVLVGLSLGLPLLLMAVVAKSPAKRYYSYLFG